MHRTVEVQNLRQILQKNSNVGILILEDRKNGHNRFWIYTDTNQPKYNLYKFDLADERYVLLATIP